MKSETAGRGRRRSPNPVTFFKVRLGPPTVDLGSWVWLGRGLKITPSTRDGSYTVWYTQGATVRFSKDTWEPLGRFDAFLEEVASMIESSVQ